MIREGPAPVIGVVLLNWNGYSETAECLESLKKERYENIEVVVVDNGSVDDSADRIAEEFGWVTLLRNQRNKGFAGGCNVGIEHLLQQSVDYIMLLNNDALIQPGSCTALIETAERHESVGAVSGLIKYTASGEIQHTGGEYIDWLVKLNLSSDVPTSTKRTEFVSGAFMCISREAIEDVGVLDESFFFGFEDVEFSNRLRQEGWKMFLTPDAVIHHKGSSSAGEGSPFKFYHASRNRLELAKRTTTAKRLVFYVYFGSTRVIRAIQWSIQDQEGKKRAKAMFEGIIDHVRGKPFKLPEDFGRGPSND